MCQAPYVVIPIICDESSVLNHINTEDMLGIQIKVANPHPNNKI